jgi:lipopolysaccharide/colanic/teichoic acid biosynthesis glycosyltransferase
VVWEALIADYNKVLGETSTRSGVRGALKSIFDPLAAALLLITLSPVLGVIALMLRLRTLTSME